MTQTIPYTTKGDMRWDTIAQQAYGQASLYEGIIQANPTVPITPKVPAGTVLAIPILPDGVALTETEKLPPWKR